MAMGAAWKLRRVVRNVRYVLAIELMCAAQGIDYRAPLKPGRGVARAHAGVRRARARRSSGTACFAATSQRSGAAIQHDELLLHRWATA